MINKEYNTITDFLEDISFRNWIKQKNAADISYWNYWIANNPDKKELINKAKDLALGVSFNKNFVPKEKILLEWEKLEHKITIKNKPIKIKLAFFKPLLAAASVILLVTLGVYFFQINDKVVHKTNYGEILNIKLQDGSNVTLNSNSTLTYYKNQSRKVWLSGEAYFQVTKKLSTNAKFWVQTNDLEIEVFGTSFNVNSNQEKTDVFLKEGSIWLNLKNGGDKKMIPGNYISYSSSRSKILENKNIVNYTLQTSWKDGSLLFENLSLEKAMKKIEEAYGYTTVFKNPKLKSILITGAVPNTNLDICLKAIEKSVNVKIIKEENTFFIVDKD